MRQKKKPKRTILFVVLAILAVFGVSVAVFLYFNLKSTGNIFPIKVDLPVKDSSVNQETVSFGLPVRLEIPVIKVDAAVEQVGHTPDNSMDVPKIPADVAWFKLGPRPGEKGSAVIAGHYGRWKNGQGSVFDDLHKLKKGDKLSVKDDQGVTINFVVRESRNYDPNANANDVFGSNDGQSHLNLVTCEGVWDATTQNYSQRLVIFTDKEL